MRHSILRFLAIGALAVLLVFVTAGCTQKKSEEQAAETRVEAQVEEPEAKVGTMATIYTADNLYSCPMHPEVVTANPEALCPECGMKLEKMSDEAVTKLRESNPKGCPGCAIVVPGDSEMQKCPTCGADLKEVPQPEQGEPEGHERGDT